MGPRSEDICPKDNCQTRKSKNGLEIRTYQKHLSSITASALTSAQCDIHSGWVYSWQNVIIELDAYVRDQHNRGLNRRNRTNLSVTQCIQSHQNDSILSILFTSYRLSCQFGCLIDYVDLVTCILQIFDSWFYTFCRFSLVVDQPQRPGLKIWYPVVH